MYRAIQISAFILLSICVVSFVQAFVDETPVPGGIKVIPIQSKKGTEPKAFFNENRVTLLNDNKNKNQWIAIVGIPLGQSLGEAQLEVVVDEISSIVPFTIHAKSYRSEKILVEKKYVTPPKRVQNRIADEAKHLNWVLSQWQPGPLTTLKLVLPVTGRMSSEFGVHRILNGQPRSFHKGIDYAAPIGTSIYATQQGVVADIGEYYFTGNTVVIDHGQTFKTIYCHLNKVYVKKNQIVSQREVIGEVGKTGRATAPHLHFGVSLNNVRVSPELFFAAM